MPREDWIATFISLAVSLALFGLGAVAILSIPGLGPEAQLLLPVGMLAVVLLAPYIACSLRSRIGHDR
jgi:hypothetical protein